MTVEKYLTNVLPNERQAQAVMCVCNLALGGLGLFVPKRMTKHDSV